MAFIVLVLLSVPVLRFTDAASHAAGHGQFKSAGNPTDPGKKLLMRREVHEGRSQEHLAGLFTGASDNGKAKVGSRKWWPCTITDDCTNDHEYCLNGDCVPAPFWKRNRTILNGDGNQCSDSSWMAHGMINQRECQTAAVENGHRFYEWLSSDTYTTGSGTFSVGDKCKTGASCHQLRPVGGYGTPGWQIFEDPLWPQYGADNTKCATSMQIPRINSQLWCQQEARGRGMPYYTWSCTNAAGNCS